MSQKSKENGKPRSQPPQWLVITVSLFIGAMLAGFFTPPLDGQTGAGSAWEDPDRPAVDTFSFPKLESPFNQDDQTSQGVKGVTSPLVEESSEAARFIRGRASHVYYDPPHVIEDITFQGAGESIEKLSDYRGKYLFVNLWATWCGYCITELPSIQKLKERYANDKFDVVAISVDTNKSMPAIEEFVKQRGIGDVALYFDDRGDVQFTLPVNVLPVSFLMDPEGRILYAFGGTADWASLPAVAFFNEYVPLNSH